MSHTMINLLCTTAARYKLNHSYTYTKWSILVLSIKLDSENSMLQQLAYAYISNRTEKQSFQPRYQISIHWLKAIATTYHYTGWKSAFVVA